MSIVLIVVGCIFLFLQILSIIGGGVPEVFVNISSVDQFFYDLLYCFGFYFIGILGLGLLAFGVCIHNRRKRKPKVVSRSHDIVAEKNFTEEDYTKTTNVTDCPQKDEVSDAEDIPKTTKHSYVLPIVYSCIGLVIIGIIVLCIYLAIKNNDLQEENESLKANATTETQAEEPEALQLSFEDNSFDPCGFMDDNYIFDKTPNHFIAGLKKGIDYSVSDSYGGSGLRTYIIYPGHEYMGVEATKTSIGFTSKNEKSDIDSITYFFDIEKDSSEQILNTIHDNIFKTCGSYISCTGNYVYVGGTKPITLPYPGNPGLIGSNSEEKNDKDEDEERKDKDIEFSRLVKLVSNTNYSEGWGKGVFRVTWETKGYTITLTVNTDTEGTTFEGNVCISTIK